MVLIHRKTTRDMLACFRQCTHSEWHRRIQPITRTDNDHHSTRTTNNIRFSGERKPSRPASPARCWWAILCKVPPPVRSIGPTFVINSCNSSSSSSRGRSYIRRRCIRLSQIDAAVKQTRSDPDNHYTPPVAVAIIVCFVSNTSVDNRPHDPVMMRNVNAR